MLLLGALLGFIGATAYSIRNSQTKDFAKLKISKSSFNFYIRLFSLPIIYLSYLIANENMFDVKQGFIYILIVTILVMTITIYYQTHIFQTQKFSTVESLAFLNVIFTTIGGIIVFNEILGLKQYIGIAIIVVAYIELFIRKRSALDFKCILAIVALYVLYATMDILNKAGINLSGPLTFGLLTTIGSTLIIFIGTLRGKNKLYLFNNRQINKYLFFTILTTSLAYIALSYGYKLLPVGILATILSLKTFISIFISHKIYKETELKHYIKCTIIAFIGVILIFL